MTTPSLSMETVGAWLTEQSGRPTCLAGDVRTWNVPGPDGASRITIILTGPNGRGGIRARDFTTEEPVLFRNLEALQALILATKQGAA